MKNSFWHSLKTLALFALCAIVLPMNLTAQEEIEKDENTSSTKIEQLYKARAAKLDKVASARLRSAQEDLKRVQGASFKVAATEALERDPKELLGIQSAPAPMSAAEIQKMERENETIIRGAQSEINSKRVASAPDPLNTSGVGNPTSFYFAGTPVKNQGGCGSCWAFAAAAAWEASYKRFYGVSKNMSEQELLACGKTCGGVDAGSCNGGWSDRALDHIKCNGAPTETAYPYNTALGNICVAKPKTMFSYSWGSLYAPSAATLKSFIMTYGGVVVYMKAGINSFYGYAGGIYNGYPNTSWNDIDHAVVLCGWNDTQGYWIIKNSWGTSWGIGGRAYIKYGHCNIGGYCYYTLPKP